jgi:hypothetical protein
MQFRINRKESWFNDSRGQPLDLLVETSRAEQHRIELYQADRYLVAVLAACSHLSLKYASGNLCIC